MTGPCGYRLSRAAARALLAGALFFGGAAQAQAASIAGVTLPETIEVGGKALPLRGCGVREALFFEIYVAALYLPEPDMRPRQILSADTAKAVRLHIVYGGDMPEDIPDDWREPLRRMARNEIERAIRDLYQTFQSGDQVTLRYAPDAGFTANVNGEQIQSAADHEQMAMLLELWIGDRAVSPNLRQLMLSGVCGVDVDAG